METELWVAETNVYTTRYVIHYVHKRNTVVIEENVFDYFQSFLIDMFFSLSFCITCKTHTCDISLYRPPVQHAIISLKH